MNEKTKAAIECWATSPNSSMDNKPSSIWFNKSYAEKFSLVQSELHRLRNQGYSVTVEESYFIGELDAFYDGNSDEPTSNQQAILLVGKASNKIKE
ncbi:hypothetical protein [Neobacillus vireti]|uniref:hypothetical protein n=1 Tax=Neobacillus vireti TaxID=220686 RepID=UPI0030009173